MSQPPFPPQEPDEPGEQPPGPPPSPPPWLPSGQPSYGEFPYGQPSYVPPPYGPPGQSWGPPGGVPPKKSHGTAITLGVLAAVVALAVGVTAFFFVGRNKANDLAGSLSSLASLASSAAAVPTAATKAGPVRSNQPPSTNTSIPRATVPPDDLGSDPVLDRLARSCYDGAMQACDDLFADAQSNSLYEAYGDTCAGRQDPATDIYCTASFPGS